MAKKKKQPPERRNFVQMGHLQSNRKSGAHKDLKKEAARKECRKKVQED